VPTGRLTSPATPADTSTPLDVGLDDLDRGLDLIDSANELLEIAGLDVALAFWARPEELLEDDDPVAIRKRTSRRPKESPE